MAISLARAVCLSARDRRISLHGLDAGVAGGLAVVEIVRRNASAYLGLAACCRAAARIGPRRAGMAGAVGLCLRLRARAAGRRERALAMARSAGGVARIYFAFLDGQVVGFFKSRSLPCGGGAGVRNGATARHWGGIDFSARVIR